MPLSSRKTRCCGSTLASSAHQVARASTISGRSCSCARRVFFARQAQLPQRPAHSRAAHLHPSTLDQLGRVLGQGQIVALGHQLLELVQRRRVQPGSRTPGVWLGLAPLLGPPFLQPAIDRGLANLEQLGDLGSAQPAPLAGQQGPLAQVSRIGSWHDRLSLRAHHTKWPSRHDAPDQPAAGSRANTGHIGFSGSGRPSEKALQHKDVPKCGRLK